MSAALLERPMAKGKMPVRIDDEALEWARIASGYTGESMADYVSRIVKERARDDARALHAQRFGDEAEPPKPQGKSKPKP